MMAEEGGEEEDWEVVEEEEGGSSGAFPRSGSSASTAIHVPAAAVMSKMRSEATSGRLLVMWEDGVMLLLSLRSSRRSPSPSNPNAPTARYEYLHPREELRRRESEARPPPKYTAEE